MEAIYKRQSSIDNWVRKGLCIYAIKYYLKFYHLNSWVDLEVIILSEISQTEKDKYHKISLICGMVKNKINETQNRKNMS